jgi:N-acetylmuramoyl-L-alanine amidase
VLGHTLCVASRPSCLTRDSDNGVGPCVDQRAALANAAKPDAIISIHADGGPASGHGFHVNYAVPRANADTVCASSTRIRRPGRVG